MWISKKKAEQLRKEHECMRRQLRTQSYAISDMRTELTNTLNECGELRSELDKVRAQLAEAKRTIEDRDIYVQTARRLDRMRLQQLMEIGKQKNEWKAKAESLMKEKEQTA